MKKNKCFYFLFLWILFFVKIILLLLNILSMFLNSFLLLDANKEVQTMIKTKESISIEKIKSTDSFFLFFSNLNYKDISNYLNSKFDTKQLVLNFNKKIFSPIGTKKAKKKKRKKIRIFNENMDDLIYHKKCLNERLKDKFIIKYTSNNPDYLFYNICGDECTKPKYKNAIKIAFYFENEIPDFNEADYAIGHYHINYLDRYFKFNIFLRQAIFNFKLNRDRALESLKFKKKKFCAALISNNWSTNGFRLKFIKKLSEYKKVDMGGKIGNNIGRIIERGKGNDFFREYKFSISMENSDGNGYISEKIVNSLNSGTIPIYYGNYMADEYINPKTYILIRGEKDINEKIEYIKTIDNNDTLYESILKENVLLDRKIKSDTEKELREFLFNIFEQEKSKAFRKTIIKYNKKEYLSNNDK